MYNGQGQSGYANRSRELMKLAQKLRDIGAQSSFDIPRIAVIGGQSAGKSSLVEAISGIHVPRDSGTCTRCPMEINLSTTPGPWVCKISLRIEFDSFGSRLPVTQSISFGSPFSNPDEVGLMLGRAQTAILNYPKSSDLFLSRSIEELKHYNTDEAFRNGTLKFSKNCVVVDISDRQGPNLSFIDLPGLIQNEKKEIVKLVEGLVKEYIKGNCLIIIAIPMSDDIENQKAMRISLEQDTDRSRTIGVLTKPDTLTSGAVSSHRKWVDLLSGKGSESAHALKLGYYCVKLPDDAERETRCSLERRREIEGRFFSETSPWKSVLDRKRFGVVNLTAELSRQLTSILNKIIPTLINQAQGRLKEARVALDKLPEISPLDPLGELIELTTGFCEKLSATVYGNMGLSYRPDLIGDQTKSGKAFVQSNRENYRNFKNRIKETAPNFQTSSSLVLYAPDFNVRERRRTNDFDLPYVQNVIKKSITWELPNNVPFEAKSMLLNEIIKGWDEPAEECFNNSVKILTSCIEELLLVQFGRYANLHSYMKDAIDRIFDSCRKNSFVALKASIQVEKYPLFTQNESDFSELRQTWLKIYCGQETTPKSVCEEIIVMSDVMAYFIIAQKRFSDTIPMTIEHTLNQALADVIKKELLKKLLSNDSSTTQKLERLMEENPETAQTRKDISNGIQMLEKIETELHNFLMLQGRT